MAMPRLLYKENKGFNPSAPLVITLDFFFLKSYRTSALKVVMVNMPITVPILLDKSKKLQL